MLAQSVLKHLAGFTFWLYVLTWGLTLGHILDVRGNPPLVAERVLNTA